MFRKLMPVAKKPWAKDVKKQPVEPELTSDGFTAAEDAVGDEEEEEDYEYYDDDFFHNSQNGLGGTSKMMSTRFSSIADLKQASLYFDYKLSNRNLDASGGHSPKAKKAPRMSTGIVPTPMPELPSTTNNTRAGTSTERESRPRDHPRGKGQAGARKQRFNSILDDISTEETIIQEEGEEEDSDEDSAVRMVKVRSLSPKRKMPAPTELVSSAPAGSRRSQLVKRNSWTSSRDLKEPEPQKPGANKKKGAKGKKKKKEGSSDDPTSPTVKKKKKKKKVASDDSSATSTKSSGSSTKRGKSPKPARRSLQRSNSWTSSRGLDTSKSDNTETTSPRKKSAAEELRDIINAPKFTSKAKSILHGVHIMEQLKKTAGFCTSMAHLTKKKDFDKMDKDEIEQLQQQLSETLAQVEQLTLEQEKAMELMSASSTEVDELKMMLYESAKENNELHNRLELIQSEMEEGQGEIERHKQNFETVLEEKDALADELNQIQVELRTLRSQMKRAEARASVASAGPMRNVSVISVPQNDAFEKEILVQEQAELLEEKDKKIEELEKRIVDGGGEDAQRATRLFEELEALKKEHKKAQLESSVQLAKKDAIITKLQNSTEQEASKRQALIYSKTELEMELKNLKVQLALAEQEAEKSAFLREQIKELETRVLDAETVEKGLQAAIDKWTDKTFEWREKAEALEAELLALKGGENGAENQPKQAWGIF